MKITFDGTPGVNYISSSPSQSEGVKEGTYSKVRAIKAVRQYNLMGLKECKEAIELAVEQGFVIVPDGEESVVTLRQQLKRAGPFDAESTQAELYDAIEHAIGLAAGLRKYPTVTALITLLPEERLTD